MLLKTDDAFLKKVKRKNYSEHRKILFKFHFLDAAAGKRGRVRPYVSELLHVHIAFDTPYFDTPMYVHCAVFDFRI